MVDSKAIDLNFKVRDMNESIIRKILQPTILRFHRINNNLINHISFPDCIDNIP